MRAGDALTSSAFQNLLPEETPPPPDGSQERPKAPSSCTTLSHHHRPFTVARQHDSSRGSCLWTNTTNTSRQTGRGGRCTKPWFPPDGADGRPSRTPARKAAPRKPGRLRPRPQTRGVSKTGVAALLLSLRQATLEFRGPPKTFGRFIRK